MKQDHYNGTRKNNKESIFNLSKNELKNIQIIDSPEIQPIPPDYGNLPSLEQQITHTGNLVRKWKFAEPEPIRYLVENLIPSGEIGMISAPGGTGKSMITNQLAYAIATGADWLNRFQVHNPGPVLLLNCEDAEHHLHRRFHVIANREFNRPINPNHLDRIHPVSLIGHDMRLLDGPAKALMRIEQRIQWIIDYAKAIAAELVITDPLVSFMGADENSNSDAQVFIDAMRYIATEASAAVLIVHHTSKNALMQGATGQGSHRGASAFVDGCRFAFGMATMDNPNDYGIAESERKNYVALELNKSNYGPPGEKIWLRREYGGYLSFADLEPVHKEVKADNAELHDAILTKLKEEAEQGRYHSQRGFREKFASTQSMLGSGEYSIRGAINRLLDAGDLTEEPPPIPIHNKRMVLMAAV